MKSTLKIATMLAVGLMLTISQAIAAPTTWSITDTDAVVPNYLDITNITVATNGSNYDISMALNGDITTAPTGLKVYQVNFGNTESTLFTDPAITTLYFRYDDTMQQFTAQNLTTPSNILIAGGISTTNGKSTLTWSVGQSNLNGNMNYFAGQTALGLVVKDTTQTASTTPIPGAIWLLGSGIIGLVGLRRRQSGCDSLMPA